MAVPFFFTAGCFILGTPSTGLNRLRALTPRKEMSDNDSAMAYSNLFRRTQIYTYQIQQQPELLYLLCIAGFHWIRRVPQDYNKILRQPTIGCLVEFYASEYPGTVEVDSAAGRRLLKRLSYF
jgi:hypothetical protein